MVDVALEHVRDVADVLFEWRGCGIWRHRTSELVLARRRTDMVLRPGNEGDRTQRQSERCGRLLGVAGSCPASVDPAALHIGRCGGGAALGAVKMIRAYAVVRSASIPGHHATARDERRGARRQGPQAPRQRGRSAAEHLVRRRAPLHADRRDDQDDARADHRGKCRRVNASTCPGVLPVMCVVRRELRLFLLPVDHPRRGRVSRCTCRAGDEVKSEHVATIIGTRHSVRRAGCWADSMTTPITLETQFAVGA